MTRKKAVVLVLAALMAATTVFPATASAYTGDENDPVPTGLEGIILL